MITENDLAGFLALRAGFRHELRRLADAAASPNDREHEELLEAHLALVLNLLHAHQTLQAEHVCPFLVEHAPGSAAELTALATELVHLGPLVEAVGENRTPLTERAGTIRQLHELVEQHLDREERIALPLVLMHYTPEMVERDRRTALAQIGRRRMALVFGWIASCLEEDQLAAALFEHPRLVQYSATLANGVAA